jgi:hypothetical protein
MLLDTTGAAATALLVVVRNLRRVSWFWFFMMPKNYAVPARIATSMFSQALYDYRKVGRSSLRRPAESAGFRRGKSGELGKNRLTGRKTLLRIGFGSSPFEKACFPGKEPFTENLLLGEL